MTISHAFWERLQKNLKDNTKLNEADTKGRLVEPVLSELGWDMLGDEIVREHGVDVGSGTGHADYAMKVGGRLKVLVEVKPLGSELDERRAKQAISYGAVEKVKWCVLTNGRKYQIYNSDWSSNPRDSLFRQFELDPDGSPPEELSLLSRESVGGTRLDDMAMQSKFALRLRAHLDAIMPELRRDTIQRARNAVFSRIKSEVPDTTREGVLKGIEPLLRIEILSEALPRIREPEPKTKSTGALEEDAFPARSFWLTPVKDDDIQSAEECVRTLVVENGIYAFGENTPGRKKIKSGDQICFYATGRGVIGHATVSSSPEEKRHGAVRHSDRYGWVFGVSNPTVHLDQPRPMTLELRSRLDAFKGKDPARPWAWFVQSTGRLTERDFRLLTGT